MVTVLSAMTEVTMELQVSLGRVLMGNLSIRQNEKSLNYC